MNPVRRDRREVNMHLRVPIVVLLTVLGALPAGYGRTKHASGKTDVGMNANAEVVYRNTERGVSYAGSSSCGGAAGCHREVTESYSRTPMGRSMALANTPENLAKVPHPIRVRSQRSNRYFEVWRQGADLYQSEYGLDPNGEIIYKRDYKLEYAVGAGNNGWTFTIRVGDFLYEAPLTYYARDNRGWDLSPGFEGSDQGFHRALSEGCMNCHNGQPVAVPNFNGKYQNPPFRFNELAIGCEACHGPGELHVKEAGKKRKKTAGIDTSIVNPAALSPRVSDDVCMNCHQGGSGRIPQPGKGFMDYRPGRPLFETAALFTLPIPIEKRKEADAQLLAPPKRGGMEMPGWWKVSSMQMSKCYQASGGKLSCGTCHVIHDPPTPATRAAYYRKKCFLCHNDRSCKLSVQARGPENDCVGCHMPKREMGGIGHTQATSHRIIRLKGQPLPDVAFEKPAPDLPGLLCLNRPTPATPMPPLTRLLAYASSKKNNPVLENEYATTLAELAKAMPDDPYVQGALGHDALTHKDPERAADLLSRALQGGNRELWVYQALGEALARLGRMDEAAKVLEQGIEVSPSSSGPYKTFVAHYLDRHEYAKALALLKRYIEEFPEDYSARQIIRKLEGAASR
jgi:hypothetical protein